MEEAKTLWKIAKTIPDKSCSPKDIEKVCAVMKYLIDILCSINILFFIAHNVY